MWGCLNNRSAVVVLVVVHMRCLRHTCVIVPLLYFLTVSAGSSLRTPGCLPRCFYVTPVVGFSVHGGFEVRVTRRV